jgi:acetoin utilization deacetylase AcuC-like enzyme
MTKYRRLRERVASELPEVRLIEPLAATPSELALAHDPAYIAAVLDGRLSAADQRAIGFPWSREMVERSCRSAGATIGACRAALDEGVAVNLAGGTHHAQRARGAGYCVFNDSAVAARRLQVDRTQEHHQFRVAVVDLDVHQGDGTAEITAGDDSIFTLSLHGERNFPVRKQVSDLDVALPDRTGDDEYLRGLDRALDVLAGRFEPNLIIYLAGADAHENDRLGRLGLSTGGMGARDQRVFEFAEKRGVPIAVTMAGGYGRDPETTVAVHFQTVRLAALAWSRRRSVHAQREAST